MRFREPDPQRCFKYNFNVRENKHDKAIYCSCDDITCKMDKPLTQFGPEAIMIWW
jgi:hypothetical protein